MLTLLLSLAMATGIHGDLSPTTTCSSLTVELPYVTLIVCPSARWWSLYAGRPLDPDWDVPRVTLHGAW